jgi:3-oxoacyl-[acyl-carrier protein] reductase
VDLDPAALRQMVKVQLALGHEVEGLAVDLADEQAIATLLAGLERLDVLVHNAAYFPLTPSPTSPRHCCNARWRSTWARCSG